LIPPVLDPNQPWGTGVDATRSIEIELTTGILTTLADGGQVGPSPTITVVPDGNTQVRCGEGVSNDFGAAGEACSFSSWDYQRPDAGAGGSDLIRALHTVSVRAVGQAPPAMAPTAWTVVVSGNNVDGAPSTVIYYALPADPTPTDPDPNVQMVEKEIAEAGYEPDIDSPYVGTMVLTTPTGSSIAVPVQAHIINDVLALYDPSRLIAPNGILSLRRLDFATVPFPVQAYVRWVYVDASPAYAWNMDAKARIISFRQQANTAKAPIEATGALAFGDMVMLSEAFGQGADLRFSLTLSPRPVPTCSVDADVFAQPCNGSQVCEWGFCAEPAPGGPPDSSEGLATGTPFLSVQTKLSDWLNSGPLVDTTVLPSAIWCAQDPAVEFTSKWPETLFKFAEAKLLDYDMPCVAPSTGANGKPQIGWGGPFPFSHRESLEKLGVYKDKLNTADLFGRCLQELQRTGPPWVDSMTASFPEFTGGLLDYKADCVSLGPVGKLLAENGDSSSYSLAAYDQWLSLVARIAQEWFRLHGFLMHQGVEQLSQEDVILRQSTSSGTSGASGISATPAPDQLLAVMERGLAFGFSQVLQPIVFNPQYSMDLPVWTLDYRTMTGMQRCAQGAGGVAKACPPSGWECESQDHAAALAAYTGFWDCDPDYIENGVCPPEHLWRHCVIQDAAQLVSSDDIPKGFLPVLTDALTGYLRVVEADLEKTMLDSYQEQQPGGTSGKALAALIRYGTAMRLTTYFQAMGVRMAKADSNCSTTDGITSCQYPHWYDRWRNAARELDLQMARAANAAQRLASGQNPLGVPDDDTPVFFGDVQGTNSRYFASSDYLINTWAGPAVGSARGALSTARDAWISARNASLTTQQNETAHEQRLDDIATPAGRTILDNCGGLTIGGAVADSRSVVESLAKLEPSIAHKTLNECYVGGGESCTLKPDDAQITEARLAGFIGNAAAARSELCRLDYMRVNYPSEWVAATEARPKAGTGHFAGATASAKLTPFMSGTSTAPFCDDCAGDPTCLSGNCVEDCVVACGVGPGVDRCWQANTRCWYRFKDCTDMFVPAYQTGDEDSNCAYICGPIGDYFTCRRNWDGLCPEKKYEDCQEIANMSPFPLLQEMSLKNCAGELAARKGAPENTKDLADYALDCLSRHVHGSDLPPLPADARSSKWKTAEVGSAGGVLEIYIPSAGDGTIQAADPQMAALDLYSPDLQVLRASQGWNQAVALCGSEGYGAPLPDWELPRECLRGKLGVAWSQLHDIWSQAERDKALLFEKVGNWSAWLLSCHEQGLLNQLSQQELSSYLGQRGKLLGAAGDVDTMRTVVLGCASGDYVGGALGGLFSDDANQIRAEVTQLDALHAKFQAEMEAKIAAIQCATNNKTAYNAIGPVRAQIAQRLDEFQTALQNFANLLQENGLAFDTAAAQLDTENHRKVADFSHHYWYDEKVDTFRKQMKWAKQLTYLALRAVEFEFQESLNLRGAVVAARHPDELADALLAIQQVQATRGVNRKRPEQSSIVLSLRDDILEVADRTGAPSGERDWTASQRFKGRLRDERYTIRDENGAWLGQGIAFSMKEQGVLENRCGERLWRVTATVQGDNLSPLEPGTPLTLLKKNTFYSQYCRGHGGTEKHQVNSIRPSNQLFTGKVAGTPEEATAYTAAAMYPWFNVRRIDFYSADYTKGASEELAGRGLYGDYILLFPKQILDKAKKNPFPLENVEDVLLRVDYLSVDNLSPVGTGDQAVPVGGASSH